MQDACRRNALVILVATLVVMLGSGDARTAMSRGLTAKYDSDIVLVQGIERLPSELRSQLTVVEDYGSYQAAIITGNVDLSALHRYALVANGNRFSLKTGSGHRWDTRRGEPEVPAELTLPYGRPGLYIVQYYAPIRQEWLKQVEALGLSPVPSAYFPNYGMLYQVKTRAQLAAAWQLPFVNWVGVYQPAYKARIGRDGRFYLAQRTEDRMKIRVKVTSHAAGERLRTVFADYGMEVIAVNTIDHYLARPHLVMYAAPGDIAAIARQPEVWWVEDMPPMKLNARVMREIHQVGVGDGCGGTTS